MSRPRRRERTADALLERVGLLDRRDARPSELSGGQQQRVAICAALAHRPRLFIADEPTGELDAANATEIYELVRELAREAGATTIVVSHDPQSARVADRVVQIRDGRVSGESRGGGEPEAVVNRGGWIRLPEELVGDAARARLERTPGGILVRVAERPAQPEQPPPARAAPRGRSSPRRSRLTKVHGSGAHAIEVFHELSVGFAGGPPLGGDRPLRLRASRRSCTCWPASTCPTAGDVVVAGTALSQLDATGRAELRRDRIGLVTQGTDLVPFLTAQESVELALALRGVDRGEASERATAALGAVGLAELATQRVARLSMGERQRVALARALSARPELLLADEPTARLDEANARAVGVLFAELAQRTGTAIVCATHDPVLIEHALRARCRTRYRGCVSQAARASIFCCAAIARSSPAISTRSRACSTRRSSGSGSARWRASPTVPTCSRSCADASTSSTR